MDAEIYFKCLVACLFGNICHVAGKYNSMYVDFKNANVKYTFVQFLKEEKVRLIFNGLSSFALVYLADEFIVQSDFLMNKIKILFFFVGLTGSWVVMQIKSAGKARFRQIIDRKTNIADGVTDVKDKNE